MRPGSGSATGNVGWGLAQRISCAEGESARQTGVGREEQGRERSPSSGHAVNQRVGENRVARESVRSAVVFGEQERSEPAG